MPVEHPTHQTLTVSELNSSVAQLLQTQLPTLKIRGEAQGVKRYASGHVYFTLKDEQASVSCVMFKMRAQLFERLPREGELIEVRAKVTLYEPRGDYQLRIDAWQTAGQGALFEAFLQLKAKLTAQGLLDPERKRELPAFPKRIGIITSLHGAVLHDVASTLARRAPHITLVVYPCSVQGNDAGPQLAQTVKRVSERAQQDQLDILLICRGGGSMEDLWCFNHEQLALEIAQCTIPTVSGVGHETDFTICDFVADVRAPTPTAAAELCAVSTQTWHTQLNQLKLNLSTLAQDYLGQKQQRIDMISTRLAHAKPSERLKQQQQQLQQLSQRLQWSVHTQLQTHKHTVSTLKQSITAPNLKSLEHTLTNAGQRLRNVIQTYYTHQNTKLNTYATALHALNPEKVLERGYAIVINEDLQALTAPAPADTRVTVRYAQGSQTAILGAVLHNTPAESA